MGGCSAYCLAAALALVCSIAVASAQQSAVAGVHLSDLHVDPFFGTEKAERADCNTKEAPWYGLPGCDTSPAMMRAALGDVATTMAATNASVLYYTGDWLRHDMEALKANASDIGLSIFQSVASAFGDIARKVKVVAHPAVPVSLGNEDFIPDYHFNISADGEPVDKGEKSLLKGMASILATTGLLNESQAKTFSYCGYTSQHVEVSATLTLRVISLNTLIWSKKLKPKTTAKDPCGQFAWFETELAKAKTNGEKVHVLSHIFPDVLLWDSTHIDAYKGLLEQYSDVVQAQFFGHIHRMSYIVQNPGLFGAPRMPTIHVGGPITRASSTNPDYALVSLDSTTGAVVDRVQRYFNSSSQSWVTGSSLRDILRLASLASPADLVAASTRLMNTSDATANADFQRFWQLFQGGMTTEACTGLCQKAIMCSTVSLDVWDILAECKILFGTKSDTDDDNHRRQREIMVKLFSE